MNTETRAKWIAHVALVMIPPAKATSADILNILTLAYNYGYGEGMAEAGRMLDETFPKAVRA